MTPDELALAFKIVFVAVSIGALYYFVHTALIVFGG